MDASRGHSCRCSGFASAILASTTRVTRCLERIGVVTVEPIGLGVAQDRFECEAGLHLNGLCSDCWARAPRGQPFNACPQSVDCLPPLRLGGLAECRRLNRISVGIQRLGQPGDPSCAAPPRSSHAIGSARNAGRQRPSRSAVAMSRITWRSLAHTSAFRLCSLASPSPPDAVHSAAMARYAFCQTQHAVRMLGSGYQVGAAQAKHAVHAPHA